MYVFRYLMYVQVCMRCQGVHKISVPWAGRQLSLLLSPLARAKAPSKSGCADLRRSETDRRDRLTFLGGKGGSYADTADYVRDGGPGPFSCLLGFCLAP